MKADRKGGVTGELARAIEKHEQQAPVLVGLYNRARKLVLSRGVDSHADPNNPQTISVRAVQKDAGEFDARIWMDEGAVARGEEAHAGALNSVALEFQPKGGDWNDLATLQVVETRQGLRPLGTEVKGVRFRSVDVMSNPDASVVEEFLRIFDE